MPPLDVAQTVAISTVEASLKSLAAAIIVITTSGRSAHLIAKYRPRCPIIAVTRNAQTARQAHLYRAILPLYYDCKYNSLKVDSHELGRSQTSLIEIWILYITHFN